MKLPSHLLRSLPPLFLLFSFHLFSVISSAQTPATVRGTVRSSAGEALTGVTISIKGSQASALTDAEGKYSIRVANPQAVLQFSYVGFTTHEQAVNKQSAINVTLTELTKNLDEVIVVGYGTQKRSEVTGSIGSIKAEQMDRFAGGSINTSLQGKVAGLQITTNSGEPGAGANITLRGVSSINGASQPLIIIDGIPVNNDAFEAEDGASFSPLNDINPSDIESIEVLKDAGTASIYGSRASNGVILITTKQGRGASPKINLSYSTSVVEMARTIGVLNASQFRSAYIDAIYNSTGSITSKESVIDSLHPYYRESFNWQDIMYPQTVQHKVDLNISGASKEKNMNYYVSAGYRNLKPTIYNTKYDQLFATARVNYKISKSINGSTKFNLSNFGYNRQHRDLIQWNLRTMPMYNPYDPISGQLIPLFEGSKVNPLAQALYVKNDIKRWRIIANQDLTINLLKGLDFKTNLSVDYSNTEASYFNPPILSSNGSNRSVYSDLRHDIRISIANENVLTYKTRFNKNHNVDFLLGQSYQIFKSDRSYVRGIGAIDNQITTINGSATVATFSNNLEENVLLSYFGRANYNFKGKYLFSAIVRRDGSSRFGEQNRFSYFPSVSAGWRFYREDFMDNFRWLSEGKLRASYGITGNQNIGNYASMGSISRRGSYLGGLSLISDGLENAELKWESTHQFNVGVDLGFLRNRITVTADYYEKTSNDLLFNVQVPSQTGYSSLPYNFGSLSNKGFELAVDAVIIEKPIKWSASITAGLNRNRVTELPGNEDYRPNAFSLARVGEAVGVFYGYKAMGVYSRDEDNVYKNENGVVTRYKKGSTSGADYKGGDVIYHDLNGDGVINQDDLQIIGDPTPAFFGGLQNSLSYKNWDFSFFFNYVMGNDLFNNVIRELDSRTSDANFSTDQLRRWRNPGDVTDVPKLVKADPMENYAISDRFVEDGSFVRLQNISLGYNVPAKFSKKLGVDNASIGFSVQNLLTWGSYKGYDPEVSTGNTPLGYGIDNGDFPKTRSYNLSVNVKF